MTSIKFLLTILLVGILISSCDKGIEPGEPSGPSGFSGKITLSGKWPEGITRTHVVVFRNRIVTVQDFFLPNLIFVVDSIPYGSKEFKFNSLENPFTTIFKITPGGYNYVVVAQSRTQFMSFERKDWTVVGIYCENGNQSIPKTMIIPPGKIAQDINIMVDFSNPPPQPPM
jgi:hypothetical protein